jgi:uncharacterized membrane protein
LTEDDDGSLIAGGYPDNFTQGSPTPLTAAVHNDEGQAVEYTVVVQLERVDTTANDVTVTRRQAVTRLERTVPDNGTWHANHTVVPRMTGTDLRLTYLLYRGEPADQPSTGSAYRHAYIWVDVSRSP